GTPGGCADRTAVDARTDVITYDTRPLDRPWSLAGTPAADLQCRSDAQSFDICAVLSQVDEAGRSSYLTHGALRVRSAVPEGRYRLAMRPLCARIDVGRRLRVSISAARYPALDVNPGTGARSADARLVEQRVITLVLDPGQSRLQLPVIDREAA
ncbi:MAG: CocE/NonD family hydrolase, partial [Gammaproteobacteria bacterium]